MDWYQTIFEVIDIRSFSNLWFWLALAVMWSTVSHFVIGVPHDLIRRAERDSGQTLADVEALAHIYTRRFLVLMRSGELLAIWFISFTVTGLLLLAVLYRMEFAQALLCLVLPMLVVGALTLRICLIIERTDMRGPELLHCLRRHRITVQMVGMLSLFFTGMFGMYQNLTLGVLG